MPRTAEVILAKWREVERRLAETEAGTPERDWLRAEASRLRDEYHRLLDALIASQRTTADDPSDHAPV